jgi:hypothetical protein
LKRLRFAANDKLFNGSELKKEVIRYIFDHMEYDGDFDHQKFEQNPDVPPNDDIECKVMGNILWEDIEKKFGPLSSEDRTQLISALNSDDLVYAETMDALGDYVQNGYTVNQASYSFADTFDMMLSYHADVEKWDLPDNDILDDGDYNDKKMTNEHDDTKYW